MNEVLRILDRLLKKSGYTIKKQPEYNLLPLKDFSNLSLLQNAYEKFNSNAPYIETNFDLTVCLRTSINEKRAKGKRSELTNAGLEEHLLKCINSLIVSIQYAHEKKGTVSFVIFDDRSDEDTLLKINTLCKKLTCDWRVINTDKAGQGESLHQNFSYARNGQGLFYFCEDDYLHTETAVFEMMEFYKKIYGQTQEHIIIHPQEHENIFRRFNYPSYILYDDARRWRTVSHATHVFFTHTDIVKKHWQYFENTKYVGIKSKRHLGSEKETTDKLFNHFLGFSPIPALAVHLQSEHCLPPFFNWQEHWDRQEDCLNQ